MIDSEKLDLILNKVTTLESEMKDVKQDVKQKVTKIDMTLEYEIRVNIQRVAEGHLD